MHSSYPSPSRALSTHVVSFNSRPVRSGSLLLRALSCLVVLAVPTALLAERGALTFEVSSGVGMAVLPAPIASDTPRRRLITQSLTGELSARYAVSHDLAFGIAASFEPWRWLAHDGVSVDDGQGAPLVGRLVHSYSARSIMASARFYLRGYNWRLFAEPRLGWSGRSYRGIDHRQVLQAGSTRSYGIVVEPFQLHDLSVGAAAGLEHVWDRAAIGIRALGVGLLGRDLVLQHRIGLYAAYDFYP